MDINLEGIGSDTDATNDPPDEVQDYLRDIGAQEHRDQVTSQINPSDDPSLLNEDNKHYYTARALGARRGMREGELDGEGAFDTLSDVLGGQLGDIGVPVPDYSIDAQYREGEGMTAHRTDGSGSSSIALSPDDFAGPELGREAVSALYHESVHAEQWSLVSDARDGTSAVPSDRVARLDAEFDPATLDVRSQAQAFSEDTYKALPTEQEAWQADGDVGDMYERVGAMHDELEARTAQTRADLDADWQENPLYQAPTPDWQENPLYEKPEGAQ